MYVKISILLCFCHMFMEYCWIQPTANSCTTTWSCLQLPQLYHNVFTCAYCSVYVCACTDIKIHHSTVACMCICALSIYSHMHSSTWKNPFYFCSKNPACDGQHTTPSHIFIITVIKEKKKLTQPGSKREKPQVGYHFTSVVTLCSHVQVHTCSFW